MALHYFVFDFSCPYPWNVALKNINILVDSGGKQVSGYKLFICSPQLLLQMPDFHSLQLFLYPEFYTFSLSLVLSCPGDLARERTLSSVFFILFSFSLCQIGAGQFHPVHVSVTCVSVCSLKHVCAEAPRQKQSPGAFSFSPWS